MSQHDSMADSDARAEDEARWGNRSSSTTSAPPPSSDVAVVVPLAPNGCEYRARAWRWVRARYSATFPDWEIVTGTVEGPWSKGAAVADALQRTEAGTVVIADADCWSDDLATFVAPVHSGERAWATPHAKVFRFNDPATLKIVDGSEPLDVALERGTMDQTPHPAMCGGGLVAVRRDVYDACPIDPRFVGWGGEDHAWGFALTTIAGRRLAGTGALWHLWHPPQERLNRKIGSLDSERLRARYQSAGGDTEAMRALIEEGRRCRSQTSSSLPQRS